MAKKKTAFYTARMELSRREGAEVNQVELSRRSGVAQGLISDLENGKLINPTWDVLNRLAQVLGVKPEQLIPFSKLPKRTVSRRIIAAPLHPPAVNATL